MSPGQEDNLEGFKEIKIDFQEEYEELVGKSKDFPKYTTQFINIANQNAQGTRPQVVGKMSELIKQCPEKTYEGWRRWYLQNYPDAIDNATKKIKSMIDKMKEAMELIDEEMISEWVEDLVINKTAEGLIIQDIILKYLAEERGEQWRSASPEEESQNVDGYIGYTPVQIKPVTYLSKRPTVRENIGVKTIYYKKTDRYIYTYVSEDSI